MPSEALEELNSVLNRIDGGDCKVVGKLECYTCACYNGCFWSQILTHSSQSHVG